MAVANRELSPVRIRFRGASHIFFRCAEFFVVGCGRLRSMGSHERAAQVEEVCRRLEEHYVFPDVAAKLAEVLRSRESEGAYAGLDDQEFATAVTTDLQSVNGDKHLRLRHHVDPVPDPGEDGEAIDMEAYRREAQLSGYGVASVRRLAGNVGYLDTTMLHDPEVAGESIAAAMTLLSETD